jgi:tRNA-dihydrouridine synthase
MKTIEEIFRNIRSLTKKPVTVKLRKSIYSISIAKLAENIGFDAIIIHPRTIKQGYSGEPDYDFALKLKKSLNIPVVFSGNVNKDNYKEILKDFDFVMFGRAAIGNPNIFSDYKETKEPFKKYLKLTQKYNIPFRQIKFQAMNFTKGTENAKETRRKLILCKNVREIEKILS